MDQRALRNLSSARDQITRDLLPNHLPNHTRRPISMSGSPLASSSTTRGQARETTKSSSFVTKTAAPRARRRRLLHRRPQADLRLEHAPHARRRWRRANVRGTEAAAHRSKRLVAVEEAIPRYSLSTPRRWGDRGVEPRIANRRRYRPILHMENSRGFAPWILPPPRAPKYRSREYASRECRVDRRIAQDGR